MGGLAPKSSGIRATNFPAVNKDRSAVGAIRRPKRSSIASSRRDWRPVASETRQLASASPKNHVKGTAAKTGREYRVNPVCGVGRADAVRDDSAEVKWTLPERVRDQGCHR